MLIILKNKNIVQRITELQIRYVGGTWVVNLGVVKVWVIRWFDIWAGGWEFLCYTYVVDRSLE